MRPTMRWHAWMVLACAAALSACSTTPARQPLYHWGDYPAQIYVRLKGEGSAQEQIALLEATREVARAKGLALPPGFNAHLGLLYAELGQTDQFAEKITAEKTDFPEATSFMDFLLKREVKP